MKIKPSSLLLLLPLLVLSSCSDGYAQIAVSEARTLYENISNNLDVSLINDASLIIDQQTSLSTRTYSQYVFSRENRYYYAYISTPSRTSYRYEYVTSIDGVEKIVIANEVSEDNELTREKVISNYDETTYSSLLINAERRILSYTQTSLTQVLNILNDEEDEEVQITTSFYKKDDTSIRVNAETTYEDSSGSYWPETYEITIENSLIKTYQENRGVNYTSIGAKYENIAISYPDLDQFLEVETLS